MIAGQHSDGRVILMAREHGLSPMIRINGVWGPARITGEELNDFDSIDDEAEMALLLKDALKVMKAVTKMQASQKLYNAIRSGIVSLEEFRDMFVDDGLADATLKVHDLTRAAGYINARVRFRGRMEIYTESADSFSFDIYVISGRYWVQAADVTVLKNKYRMNDAWMTKAKAAAKLRDLAIAQTRT